MMSDDKQMSAAPDQVARTLEQSRSQLRRGMQIGQDDQVKLLAACEVLGDVGPDDLNVDTGPRAQFL
jgi:hypothetical protein